MNQMFYPIIFLSNHKAVIFHVISLLHSINTEVPKSTLY